VAARQFNIDSLAIVATHSDVDSIKIDALAQIGEIYLQQGNEKALEYAQLIKDFSENAHYKPGLIASLHLKARHSLQQGKYLEALRLAFEEKNYAIQSQYPPDEAKAFSLTGSIYLQMGNYLKAMEAELKAIDYYKEAGDLQGELRSQNTIARLYIKMGEFKKAETMLKQVYVNAKPLNLPVVIAEADTEWANLLKEEKRFDDALAKYKESIKSYTKANSSFSLCELYSTIGELFIEADELDSAKYYIDKSLEISISNSFTSLAIVGNLNMINLLFNKGYFRTAQSMLDSLGSKIWENATWDQRKQIVTLQRDGYLRENRFKEAFDQGNKLRIINDTLYTIQDQEKIASLDFEWQIRKKELASIQLLNLKNSQKKINAILLTGGSVGVSFLVFSIINLVQFSSKKKALYKMSEEAYKIDVENARKKEENLRIQIEIRLNDLRNQALAIAEKEKLLVEVRNSLKTLRHENNHSDIFRRIIQQIDLMRSKEKDWEDLKLGFEQVNANFFRQINSIGKELTPAEIKLATLLKLKMSIKDSSEIMGISKESVKMARYRLRKKLNLNPEADLVEYIESI